MRCRFFLSILAVCYCAAVGAQPVYDSLPIHEAFVTKFTDVSPGIQVSRPPPAFLRENIPPQPSNDAIWIPGYWAWIQEDIDFAWVCGVWRRPPIGHNWISGTWVAEAGHWTWAKGFWSPVPESQLSFIPNPPLQAIDDIVPPAPGEEYFWVPGYWEHHAGNFTWLTGTWEELNPDWLLTPANYVWRPEGYVFVPLYWDWTLDQRGNAYTCSEQGPLIIPPDLIIERLFVWYPDYHILYWHWWHFHPGWWGDCWCLPPWWFWGDWWAFSWADLWNLWWWWGHPDFLPPFWINVALSAQLPPPSQHFLDFMKNIPKPPFPIKPGNKPLLPEGKKDVKPLPKPHIPNDVKPGGKVTLPAFPSTKPQQVTPPPPPSYTPPRPQPPNESPYYPEPEQPQYYPPNTYYPEPKEPPRRPHWPRPQAPQGKYPERPHRTPKWPQPHKPPQQRPHGNYTPGKPSYTPQTKQPPNTSPQGSTIQWNRKPEGTNTIRPSNTYPSKQQKGDYMRNLMK